jgi:hypothetical protein
MVQIAPLRTFSIRVYLSRVPNEALYQIPETRELEILCMYIQVLYVQYELKLYSNNIQYIRCIHTWVYICTYTTAGMLSSAYLPLAR